eukprot:scaffold195_cov359-Prasinococcus_capsulatus_cf.AAC.12
MHEIGLSMRSQHLHSPNLSAAGTDAGNYDVNEGMVTTRAYLFDDQQYVAWGGNVSTGDLLALACVYDATLAARTGPTFGGLASTDEMCLAFLSYYPRANLFCAPVSQAGGRLPDEEAWTDPLGLAAQIVRGEVQDVYGGVASFERRPEPQLAPEQPAPAPVPAEHEDGGPPPAASDAASTSRPRFLLLLVLLGALPGQLTSVKLGAHPSRRGYA